MQHRAHAHMTKVVTECVNDNNLSEMVSEVNMVGPNPQEWWINAGVTHHVCCDRRIFTTFELVTNCENVFMEIQPPPTLLGLG